MKKRIFFQESYQKKFIKDVKKKSGLTWKKLADKLGLRYTTLSKSYRFELCSLPYELFKNTLTILENSEKNVLKAYKGEIKEEILVIGRKVMGEKRKPLSCINITFTNKELNLDNSDVKFSRYDKEKGVKLPQKLTPKLAEEIGMQFGDGFLSEKRYDYRLKGNPKDEKEYYIEYIKPLFKELYNIDLNLKESWKSYGFELYSQAICQFKRKTIGIKPGKKYKITIPEKIKVNNQEILAAFIRGLFDTDGSISFKSKYGYKKYYPVIEISLTSKKLIGEVADILNMFGFNIWEGYNEIYGRISLSGISNFKRYREFIGWSSKKNLNKVKKWGEMYPQFK